MSSVNVKINGKNKGKKLIFAKSPIVARPKKDGYYVSQALVKQGATNPKGKLHVKRGDTVMVISGKDKGKTGKVIAALPREGKLVVEGVNMIKRHTKPKQMGQSGEIIEKESPIFSSKVMLYDEAKKKPTRVGYKFLSNGKKVRVSKISGEQLD